MLDNRHRFPRYLLFTLVVALASFVGAFFYFNRGGYQPPPQLNINFQELTQTTFAGPPRDFVDTPRGQARTGVMLVDAAHRNAFRKEELVALLARVANRGHEVAYLGTFSSLSESERLGLLETALRSADSLVVILPRDSYTRQEVALIQGFLDQGGRLLLISDPTRDNDINSLAEPFGLEFRADYLSNQVEYDLNFQHIFVRDFQPDPLTRGLNEVVLYTAGSINSNGGWLAATDHNTVSSYALRTEGRFYPMARGTHRNTLAIYDLTFIVPPHNSMQDNDRLLSNIADFLTEGQRRYDLAAFPSFFKGEVDILLGQPSLFQLGTDVKGLLAQAQITSGLGEIENTTRDTVFLGLYDDSHQVSPYLQTSGVQVGSTLNVPSLSNIPLSGTSLILLNRSQDRHVLVVLGDSEAALADAVERLESGGFRAGLMGEFVGVYKTDEVQ